MSSEDPISMAVPMLDDGTEVQPDFADCSSLSYFIPLDSNFDPEEAYNITAHTDKEPFESVDRRPSLFFDESVQVCLVLKTTYSNNESLHKILKGLTIALEAHVVNSNAHDRDASAPAELIFSGTLDGGKDPKILRPLSGSSNDSEESGVTHIVWTLPVFLTRPRIRLQKPSVVITANASLTPEKSKAERSNDGYLISGTSSSLNLLGAIGTDPDLNGIKPQLSALRVSRVAPITQHAQDLLRPIKSMPRLTTRIFPICHSRVRFSRPNTTPTSSTVIAILEIDFTPFFECEVVLDSITLELDDGTVQNLTDHASLSLPLSCVAHDHVVFLYSVAPNDNLSMAKNPNREMHITINTTAYEEPGRCEPKLKMAWAATVDFTLPLNPGYGSTMQPMKRAHRPGQLSFGSEVATSLTAPAVARPDAIPALEAATSRAEKVERAVPELGITITFTAPSPDQKICVGSEFSWGVFIVNRSAVVPTNSTRKLALIAIPRRRRPDTRVSRPPSMSRPFSGFNPHHHIAGGAVKDHTVADAVLDENVIHAMQRSSVVDSADVACLSGDVRVGPLAVGACHSVELKFLALKAGIVGVEAVRVVDLGTNEHVDVRDLPTTVVVEEESAKNKTVWKYFGQ